MTPHPHRLATRRRAPGLHLEVLESRLAPAVFVVNSTLDLDDIKPGDGVADTGQVANGVAVVTLRAALEEANQLAGPDEIQFNIPGGPATITPLKPLPPVTDAVFINGLAQQGVTLLGSAAVKDGLVFALGSRGSSLQGVTLTGFVNAVTVNDANVAVVSNRIEKNAGVGVTVQGDVVTGVTISNNVIANNGGLGIDLVGPVPGVTPNDPKDDDFGPNELQNFPDLTAVEIGPGTVTIRGTLFTLPGRPYRLEFFGVTTPDPSGFGEGEVPLGTADIPAGAGGVVSFTVTFAGAAPANVSATATDLATESTSEFSPAVKATPALPVVPTPPALVVTPSPPAPTGVTNQQLAIALGGGTIPAIVLPSNPSGLPPLGVTPGAPDATTAGLGMKPASAGVGGRSLPFFADDEYFERLGASMEYTGGATWARGPEAGSPQPGVGQGTIPGALGKLRSPGSAAGGTETPLPFERSQHRINESQINEADENPERWLRWVNDVPVPAGAKTPTPTALPPGDGPRGAAPMPPVRSNSVGWLTPLALLLLASWNRRNDRDRGAT